MVTVQATRTGAPPAWAVKQRQLFAAINGAAPLFMEKYVHRGGSLRAHGKLDDDYECFASWPLCYAMGGDERLLEWSLAAWNGITRQWTYQHQQTVHREFVRHYDMLHLSEAYTGFQNFGLADPAIPENTDRARRFAGFYLGEDPEAPNYDPQRRLIRSPLTGSGGPLFTSNPDYNLIYGHASLYPVVASLEPGWEKDPARHAQIQQLYDEIVVCGDVPMNLAITGLFSHAFMLTGEERYRRWVLDYVEAWMERIRRNGGIIPDNVGLSGEIGERRQGQWWGGFYGWTGRYSVWMICHALITAAESAHLLSGDAGYLDLLRSQLDMLLERAIERDGDLLVPYKMGAEGWHDFRPMDPYAPGHLWHASMEARDWARLDRLRRGAAHGPHAYAYAESPLPPAPGAEEWRPEGAADWRRVESDLYGNKIVENEAAHLTFLGGDNPGWPEAVLDANLVQVQRNIERLRGDTYQHEWQSQTLMAQNPVFASGLGQMTLGAPFPCYNGGLVMARVRYFDAARRRPGLPPDVAALVEKLEATRTVVQLVNTSALEGRQLMVQAGGYREHCFGEVRWEGGSAQVGGSHLQVELPPSTAIRLELDTRCFVQSPTYDQPWQAGGG
ncbi:MAG: hypothetical protein IT369_04150 [Candidatus Latescibacteria bacterium]|nr:hypothetical protein [Candidatus Latescibacterota bacterium]